MRSYVRKVIIHSTLFGYDKEISDRLSFNAYIRNQIITGFDTYHQFSYTFYGDQKQLRKEIEAELDIFWTPVDHLDFMTGIVGLSVYEENFFSDIPSFRINNDHYHLKIGISTQTPM